MKKRSFDNLRPRTRRADNDVAIVEAAIARLMMQPEGQVFFDWLRNKTTFLVLGPDATDGALRGAEAKRQLMHEIECMGERGGRTKPAAD